MHGVCDDDADDDGDDDALPGWGHAHAMRLQFWCILACCYIHMYGYLLYICIRTYILVSVFHLYGYSHVTPYPQAQQATENLDAQSHRLLLKSEEAIK